MSKSKLKNRIQGWRDKAWVVLILRATAWVNPFYLFIKRREDAVKADYSFLVLNGLTHIVIPFTTEFLAQLSFPRTRESRECFNW